MRSFRRFSIAAGNRFRSGAVEFTRGTLLGVVEAYRAIGAIHLGGSCRFEPTCSVYASDALKRHRVGTALRLITVRLAKCRPGGPWGYDPVPGTCGGKTC